MPRAGFYNDNEYREYPFVFRQTYSGPALPTELVVDCGFIMGLDSGFDAVQHGVYLKEIRKRADELTFEFVTTAPGCSDRSLVFTRSLPATEWAYQHVDASPISTTKANAANAFCATEPAWSGFIVTGRLNEFAATLPNNAVIIFEKNREIEPGRIQSLVKSYLRSISVGNYARTVIQPCSSNTPSGSSGEVIVNASCIKGAIQLKAGFNCQINQSAALNELRIMPIKDANTTGLDATEFCQNGSEIKLYTAETPPTGSKFLSGGPACDEVITSINGLPAPDVKIVGGAGIQVVADLTTQHTLQIKRVENLLSPTC
jgi:hypothetical protein